MPTDRFFIAPYDQKSGLQTAVKPWLIPDEAFSELLNAYVFRGRVRKRFGSRWFGETAESSRLRFTVDTTDVAGSASGTVPGGPFTIGKEFSIGGVTFIVNVLGTPANLLVSNGSAATATFNTTTGAFNFVGVRDSLGALIVAAAVFFYPALPVMGLLTYDNNNLQNEQTIGFDTQFAYQYIAGTGWERLAGEVTPGASEWFGDDSQFFWGTTWSGVDSSNKVFFVTNFNPNEPNFMRTFFAGLWDNFRPQLDATPNFLNSARILLPFKNRLIALNTWEGPGAAGPGTNYPNRCRYSTAAASPLDVNSWRQDIPGRGNGIDAPTIEAIVSAEFVKDRLIVFFEESTWELVYTGNQAYPFAWYQLNTELGAESPFSVIPFDKVCLAVGNVGIHACNGSNVERIDDYIPDEIFKVHNTDNGIFRVYGVRDFLVEMAYWTFPDTQSNTAFPFPNRVLVYNYQTGTWGINEDSITVFGYFQPQISVTWDSETVTWDSDVTWDDGEVTALFRQVVAGNQQGYTFIIEADNPRNAPVLQITDITIAVPGSNIITITSIDHNLRENQYFYLQGITGTGNLTLLNNKIFQVLNDGLSTSDTFNFLYSDDINSVIAGVYSGGGLIARVSNISIRTKEYNFYAKEGRNAYVSRIDFMVDNDSIEDINGTVISGSQLQVNFFVSTNVENLLASAAGTGTLLGTGTLDAFAYESVPFEKDAERLWHPVYLQADGEVIQLHITMSDEQMRTVIPFEFVPEEGGDPVISYTGPALVDFQMHAMCIHAKPTSSRFQ